ncbi:MAG: hypothetical protein B7Z08_05810 [Sphingomonadales bacterium 32-68-7]|nr:MAG: hypothetical protein B7Z33_01385 [Sphingomonadales bacterium 12-68-11]OYX09316.1 MAG: hypothetical protein B7Z08_05810 [Sphingomonadales bacterium 32-68-7]
MRLFHFSDDPAIGRFEPRPVAVSSARPPGREWLNGPLVWAIDDWHQPLYLFPRDCPRILIWPTDATTPNDRVALWGERRARMIAYVERAWHARIRTGHIYRYELPAEAFEPLDDAGMQVSREAVDPLGVERFGDLRAALEAAGVEVHVLPSLAPLRPLFATTLHASGIRLRNSPGWQDSA